MLQCLHSRGLTMALLLATSGIATAGTITVGDQVSVGHSDAGNLIINRLHVLATPTESWIVRGDAIYTHALRGHADVFQTYGMLIWSPSDHWSFDATLGFAPSAKAQSAVPVEILNLDGSSLAGNAALVSRTWSLSGDVGAEYDTASEGALSWAFGGSVGARMFASTQRINRIDVSDGSVATISQLQMACAQRPCSSELQAILAKDESNVIQLNAAATVTATVHGQTDIDASATIYGYNEDPLRTGFFGLSTLGRSEAATLGLPVVPQRFALATAATRRIGALSVTASAQYGDYVEALGWNALLGVKARYRVTPAWRVTAGLLAQRDAMTGFPVSWATSTSLGASWSF